MDTEIPWGNKWCYDNDSSNFAVEGMGIPELLQFMRKPKEEQEKIRREMAGSTTEVPEIKQ
jgi:hypothetical protein